MDTIYFHESFDFVMFDLDFDQKSSYRRYCQPYKNRLLYVFWFKYMAIYICTTLKTCKKEHTQL